VAFTNFKFEIAITTNATRVADAVTLTSLPTATWVINGILPPGGGYTFINIPGANVAANGTGELYLTLNVTLGSALGTPYLYVQGTATS
jgi:hypothetical protein